jgi:hypothetical protein
MLSIQRDLKHATWHSTMLSPRKQQSLDSIVTEGAALNSAATVSGLDSRSSLTGLS